MSRLVTDYLPLLAGAPNGVKKLRELILELATSGRLLETDSDWRQTQLRELVTSSGAGWSPSCETRPRTGDEWGVLKVSAVSWSQFRPEENKALPAHLEPRPELEVCPGDFLISRANTAELVARSVVVEDTPPRLILSDKIVRLRLSGACDPRFIQLVNSAPKSRSYYARVAGGTSSSMKNVSREQILVLPVLLPSLAEQHRIVAKVDELMALCDRLETRQSDAQAAHARLVDELLGSLLQARDAEDFAECWGRVKGSFDALFTTEQSIDALKLAVMRIAVSGKLVAQHNCDKPAGTIISELAKHWGQKRNSRKAALSEVPAAEHRNLLPESWVWVRFGYVAETRLGKMLDAAKNKGMPKPYLRNTNVQWARFDLSDLKEMRLEQDELQEYSVKAGDLLICEGGEPGRCAIWRESDREIYFQKALHRARPLCGISSDYLQICLTVDSLSGSLSALFTGATIKHFTGEKLEQYVIALPPVGEQNRIVAKIDEFMALCDRIKAKLARAQALTERLAGVLVERAVL